MVTYNTEGVSGHFGAMSSASREVDCQESKKADQSNLVMELPPEESYNSDSLKRKTGNVMYVPVYYSNVATHENPYSSISTNDATSSHMEVLHATGYGHQIPQNTKSSIEASSGHQLHHGQHTYLSTALETRSGSELIQSNSSSMQHDASMNYKKSHPASAIESAYAPKSEISAPKSPSPEVETQPQNIDSSASYSSTGSNFRDASKKGRAPLRRAKRPRQDSIPKEIGAESSERRGSGSKSNNTRFLWSTELHAQFCSSVFLVGLKQASPASVQTKVGNSGARSSAIDDSCVSSSSNLTSTEEVTRCLELYRKLQSDMMVYAQQWRSYSLEPPTCLEHTVQPGLKDIPKEDYMYLGDLEYGVLPSPSLQPDEVNTPVGRAMGYLLGMIHSVSSQMLQDRIKRNKEKAKESGSGHIIHDVKEEPAISTSANHEVFGEAENLGKLTESALLAGSALHSTLKVSEKPNAGDQIISWKIEDPPSHESV